MPWKETNAMDERMRFIMECLEAGANISEICREFGVAESTGHKWLKRYREEGLRGLFERSRRPKTSPLAISADMACEVMNLRVSRPTWGARKIQGKLLRSYKEEDVPSIRTINRVFDRAGLFDKKRRRRTEGKYLTELSKPERCNDLWTADGKGFWRVLNGERCEPLTIRDAVARFVLEIRAMNTIRRVPAQDAFRGCFERYGLPLGIRVDNGPPFASMRGLHGLTKLSAWWIKLGIFVERIPPGKPQYNGAHERMHLDMARELEASPARNIEDQQRACDEFRHDFNYERPHEALGNLTPADVYTESPREYDPREPEYQYKRDYEVRKVDSKGYVYWGNKKHFLSRALSGEHIGFQLLDDKQVNLWFCEYNLGRTDITLSQPLRRE